MHLKAVASDKKADDWAALLSLPRPRYITAMLLRVLIHLLLALAAMAATPAKYYMDDTDSSIIYSPLDLWGSASASHPVNVIYPGNNSAEMIDYTRLYKNTT